MGGLIRATAIALIVFSVWLAAAPPRDASACSKVPLMAENVAYAVERSAIVATGRWVDSEERKATLRVEEALKGTAPGAEIRVDNRTTYTQVACSPYQEPFHEGHRFSKDGERWLVLLEREVDGLWQVSFNSDAAFPLVEDALAPLVPPHIAPLASPNLGTLEQLRRDVGASPPGQDLEFEARPPCNPTDDPALLTAMSTAVVRAKVTGNEGGIWTIEPIEWLAGAAGAEPTTLNVDVRRDYGETCRLFEETDWDRPVPLTGEVVVFLRPDEFGKAEWRPAAWGNAVFASNERYLTQGFPTFEDIVAAVRREATPTVAGPHPGRPAASSVPAPDPEDDTVAITVTVVFALLARAGVLGLAIRRRSLRRGSGR